MTETAKFSVSWEEYIDNLIEENKRLQSALDYANRDREDMHNKIIELWNKRESQRNMNYKLRKENKKLREELSIYDREYFDEDKKAKNIFIEEDTLQELRDLGKI